MFIFGQNKMSLALQKSIILKQIIDNETNIFNELFRGQPAKFAFTFPEEEILAILGERDDKYITVNLNVGPYFDGFVISASNRQEIKKDKKGFTVLTQEMAIPLYHSYQKEIDLEKKIFSIQEEIGEEFRKRENLITLIPMEEKSVDDLLDIYNLAKLNNDIEWMKQIQGQLANINKRKQ